MIKCVAAFSETCGLTDPADRSHQKTMTETSAGHNARPEVSYLVVRNPKLTGAIQLDREELRLIGTVLGADLRT